MVHLNTSRLHFKPFSSSDFDAFVTEMLCDPKVTEFYHSYRELENKEELRVKAEADFWHHFEESRAMSDFEIWALFERKNALSQETPMVGWAGLLHTPLSDEHGGPELQYMLASRSHGKGYATEAAREVVRDAEQRNLTKKVIAVVDIPNVQSIRVLEKVGFHRITQLDAYGSSEMYLYSKEFGK